MHVIISREDATEIGLTRYFTNKHCRNGHLTERYVLRGDCVDCHRKRDRRWRKRNPEVHRRSNAYWSAIYRERHAEKIKRYMRDYMREYRRKKREAEAASNPG